MENPVSASWYRKAPTPLLSAGTKIINNFLSSHLKEEQLYDEPQTLVTSVYLF